MLGLTALLVVLLLYVGLMLLGLLGTDGVADLDRADQEAAAGRAAQASAERAAGAVLAYDFRTLEEDRDAATRFMTAEYAKDYVGTFDTAVVDAATESKAQVSVEVQGSAVVSASVDKVRVLLFLDQTTLTADAAQPKLALNRVEMHHGRGGGHLEGVRHPLLLRVAGPGGGGPPGANRASCLTDRTREVTLHSAFTSR